MNDISGSSFFMHEMPHRAAETLPRGPDFTGPLSSSSSLPPSPHRQPWESGGQGRQERRRGRTGEEEQVNRHQEGDASPHRPHWGSSPVLRKGRAPRGLRMPGRGQCVHWGLVWGSTESSRGQQTASRRFPGLLPSQRSGPSASAWGNRRQDLQGAPFLRPGATAGTVAGTWGTP